jgi:maltooligosyltrehalose trehalohydrolase
MGQEWAASTPFQFFTDHNGELGKAITQGRRREFESFAAFRDPNLREAIPDPQAPETFQRSKLNWQEPDAPGHSETLLLYAELLQLRRTDPVFRERTRDSYLTLELDDGIIAILYGRSGQYSFAVVTDLVGGHAAPIMDDARLSPGEGRDWVALLSSNEARFGGDDAAPFSIPTTMVFVAR